MKKKNNFRSALGFDTLLWTKLTFKLFLNGNWQLWILDTARILDTLNLFYISLSAALVNTNRNETIFLFHVYYPIKNLFFPYECKNIGEF